MYIECKVGLCLGTSLVMVSFIGSVLPRMLSYKYTKTQATAMPWVGILRYMQHINGHSGIILIKNKIAIGNAKDISTINRLTIRDTTKAMFLTPENEIWYSTVLNYELHPEFNEKTLNTLALLFLDYKKGSFRGEMLIWPEKAFSYSNVFSIGFTDHNRILEQVVQSMEYINLTECKHFYVTEQLDTRWMRPTKYKCYRAMFNPRPCVYDPGMALAVNISSQWALLGMSTWGPGCALPARFINFASYVPWILSSLSNRQSDGSYTDPREKKDANFKFNVYQIDINTIVLRPPGQNKELNGECGSENTRNEYLMYHDEAKYLVQGNAVGVYTFSDFNLKFTFDWNCILIRAGKEIHLKKTTTFLKSELLDEMDMSAHDSQISDFIKIIHMTDQVQEPEYSIRNTGKTYENIDIRKLQIFFEFYKVGTFKIYFYSSMLRPQFNELGSPPTTEIADDFYPTDTMTPMNIIRIYYSDTTTETNSDYSDASYATERMYISNTAAPEYIKTYVPLYRKTYVPLRYAAKPLYISSTDTPEYRKTYVPLRYAAKHLYISSTDTPEYRKTHVPLRYQAKHMYISSTDTPEYRKIHVPLRYQAKHMYISSTDSPKYRKTRVPLRYILIRPTKPIETTEDTFEDGSAVNGGDGGGGYDYSGDRLVIS